MQILVTNNPMNWHAADEICTVEFKGSGYRHLAADISDGSRDYNLFIVSNYHGVWLDSKAYDLGCRGKKFGYLLKAPSSEMIFFLLFFQYLLYYVSGDRCSLIVIRHRRFLSYDFKYLCLTGK